MSIVSRPNTPEWDKNYELVWEDKAVPYCPFCDRRMYKRGEHWCCHNSCCGMVSEDGLTFVFDKENKQ